MTPTFSLPCDGAHACEHSGGSGFEGRWLAHLVAIVSPAIRGHLAHNALHVELVAVVPLEAAVGCDACLLALAAALTCCSPALDGAALNAGVASVQVIGLGVRLEQQRLQLEEVGLAVRLRHREALLAQQLVLLQLVLQVVVAHALQLGVLGGQLHSLHTRFLSIPSCALGSLCSELFLPCNALCLAHLEADPKGANDLEDNDPGIEGRAIRRKAAAPGGRGRGGKRKKTETYMGYEWDNGADYNLDAIVGHVTTDGKTVYANQVRLPALPCHVRSLTPSLLSQGKMRAGVKLYRCVWEDFPPDVLWYEIEANIEGTIAYAEYLERLANDESDEAAAAQEEAELEEMEEEELMPPP